MARRQAPAVDYEHGTRVAINWDEVPENSMNILAQALLDDIARMKRSAGCSEEHDGKELRQ